MQTLTAKNTLDNVMPYEEKVRLMTLSVLKEESGRELQKAAYFSKTEFNWKEHNATFLSDYGSHSLEDLLKLCKLYYGLNDLDAVRDRRQAHKDQIARRIERKSNLSA